jgi:hypothetical protein
MTVNETAEQLRDRARQLEQAAADSFDRCDTDGFLTQWSQQMNASLHRLQADVLENGGVWTFPALFDLEGNLVAAKLVQTRHGLAWGVLASEDPHSAITKWLTAHPARESTLERKGYREGLVEAPGKAVLAGEQITSVRPIVKRTDDGFSRDVAIVDNGLTPEGE